MGRMKESTNIIQIAYKYGSMKNFNVHYVDAQNLLTVIKLINHCELSVSF
jgi:hypothetical protein